MVQVSSPTLQGQVGLTGDFGLFFFFQCPAAHMSVSLQRGQREVMLETASATFLKGVTETPRVNNIREEKLISTEFPSNKIQNIR